MGGLLLLTVALLLTGSCDGRPSERSPRQLMAGGSQADRPIAGDPLLPELQAGGLRADELGVGETAGGALGQDAQRQELLVAHDAHLAVEDAARDVAHTPGDAKARNPRYFPLGLPGSGLGGGFGGGGYHRLFGLYPSLFGGTYYSIFGGVSQGGPFPYPSVPYHG